MIANSEHPLENGTIYERCKENLSSIVIEDFQLSFRQPQRLSVNNLIFEAPDLERKHLLLHGRTTYYYQ